VDALFNKGEKDSLMSFLKVAARTQGKIEGGLGMVMQLAQGGAVVGLATGHADPAEAAAIFVTPRVLAHMMTNPRYMRILVKGLSTPMVKRGAGGTVAQLTTAIQEVEDFLVGTERVPAPIGLTEQ
jgi:hypothetical protein